MGLIERRIGLLFAVFLSLLLLGAGKAAWLGVVKAGTLKHAASTQQTADLVVPARRGAIIDRNGTELAVSQPAMTLAATPASPTSHATCRRPARARSRGSRSRGSSSSPSSRACTRENGWPRSCS